MGQCVCVYAPRGMGFLRGEGRRPPPSRAVWGWANTHSNLNVGYNISLSVSPTEGTVLENKPRGHVVSERGTNVDLRGFRTQGSGCYRWSG